MSKEGRTAIEQVALDGALYSVWLHGNWYQLTRNMTSEQREAAATAVRRHEELTRDPDEPLIFDPDLCWWDRAYRHNVYGVDTWRLGAGANVIVQTPDGGIVSGWVEQRGAQSIQLACGVYGFGQVLRVVSSPFDQTLARLDAPTT
ncbi:hypothetical protein [Verrucosispora sp. WMMC514]|uniref:hypothetical protein n=1 Tax=Verrucosispora sp. WMMC514 TaxID=3015156 RepID=UPI00248B3BDC|nr:hypothetical protein [Verrucosispora sp. WMMC514]WBB94239.1 hypothetical protein O7597_15420 [Verrucosispora sp. WMMC514]